MTRVGLPLADAAALGRPARRTAIVRVVLAVALVLVAAVGAATARAMRVGESAFFSPGSAGIVVLDLSSSTEAAPPEEIELAMNRVARSGRQAGLVLFSDVAYEALPPSAKAAELLPFIRYFKPPPPPKDPFDFRRQDRGRANPWSSFRGGTRISAGLRLARRALDRSGSRGVLLISDLNDSLFDVPQLTRTLKDYARADIRLRVVGLNPTPDDRAFWVRQVGEAAFVPEPALTNDPGRHRAAHLVGGFPRAFVTVAILLAIGLAANELWGRRLSWRTA